MSLTASISQLPLSYNFLLTLAVNILYIIMASSHVQSSYYDGRYGYYIRIINDYNDNLLILHTKPNCNIPESITI
jgi:hypothetical protein